MRPITDQTILVTGATDGHGRALAKELAAAGATVVLHGRDDARGRRTLADVEAPTGNTNLRWMRADLASLDEVRALAQAVTQEHERLDALVNNAGVGTTVGGGDPSTGRRPRPRRSQRALLQRPPARHAASAGGGCRRPPPPPPAERRAVRDHVEGSVARAARALLLALTRRARHLAHQRSSPVTSGR